MSRLTIDVTQQQHQSLKAMAALQGKTVKQSALERLFPTSEDSAMQDLRALLEQGLAQCGEGTVDKAFTEIAEDVILSGGKVRGVPMFGAQEAATDLRAIARYTVETWGEL